METIRGRAGCECEGLPAVPGLWWCLAVLAIMAVCSPLVLLAAMTQGRGRMSW